ncbi:hypothetical protein Cgig2_009688 [Carnegiea gigantea]|uniref:Reverse transcriptase zinc-binding domain-containing protein n=1 Tax=Carnegiea gigantea TaxID=171969 RepID=A0A9Q1K5X0_9CARY|nr:hypothetical protein Cgig2_009688 [Carnegiea gigantea]
MKWVGQSQIELLPGAESQSAIGQDIEQANSHSSHATIAILVGCGGVPASRRCGGGRNTRQRGIDSSSPTHAIPLPLSTRALWIATEGYIKDKNWWDYALAPDRSWTWKKICSTKDILRAGCTTSYIWQFQGRRDYKVSIGYNWLIGGTRVSWDKVVWARASLPRRAFISWVYVQCQLSTKKRLSHFIPQSDLQCVFCNNADEDDTHPFTVCPYATEFCNSHKQWWPFPSRVPNADMTTSLARYRASLAQKQISYAIYATSIYFI